MKKTVATTDAMVRRLQRSRFAQVRGRRAGRRDAPFSRPRPGQTPSQRDTWPLCRASTEAAGYRSAVVPSTLCGAAS